MGKDINLFQGGYGGGSDEQFFKFFTSEYMEYWWYFREVLRGSQGVSSHWMQSDGKPLPDEHQKELIAISLLHYGVHTGMAEALKFYDDMQAELHRQIPHIRFFEVRRFWKAAYSSLYTSFNALCNIVYVLVCRTSVWKKNEKDFVMNYTPTETIKQVKKYDTNLAGTLERCDSRLGIRSHLDHYWAIWTHIDYGTFLMDENFKKGYIALRPTSEVHTTIDARKLASEDILGNAQDFNIIYKTLALENGYLDQYLSSKGWTIDYSDYGFPHNGQRPRPE